MQGNAVDSNVDSTEIDAVRTVLQDGVGPALSTVPMFFMVAMIVGVLASVALIQR